ncbi:flippase [Elizabethkingia anophelis]|uniref:flippase n=1 Tax=Elizabethkingia anophelis TaxID=1117645 RepID=UPI003731CA74
MANAKTLIKNIASLGVVQMVNFIFPLITVPYVSRIIGPEGYGIINYATAFIVYFTLLIAYGFDLTATRRISKNPEINNVSMIASEVLLARFGLFIVSSLFFILSYLYIEPLSRTGIISIILFIGTISTVISPQFIFQGFQDLGIFAKVNFIRGILNTILVFILIKKSSDYLWLPILTASFSIIINIFLFFYSQNKFNIRYKIVDFNRIMKLILDEKMIFFSTVVISLYTSTNTVILGFFADNNEVGYYTTSQNFLNIVNSVLSIPLATALYPYIGKAFGNSKEEGLEKIRIVTPIIFYLTFFASLIVLIFAPITIKIFYGHKFDLAIPALRITAFLPFVVSMSNVFGIQVMLNLNLDKVFFKTTLIASVLGVFFNIFMSKYLGYIGTAWNCLIIEAIVTFLMFMALRYHNIHILRISYFHPSYIYRTIQKIIKKS